MHNAVTLNCMNGTTLHIHYANYGRLAGPEICDHPSISDLNCMAASSMSIVTAACEGLTTCTVSAENSVFGDPCVGTYKYLEIHYSCETGGVPYDL